MDNKVNEECKCPKKCIRHGNCDACNKHHLKIKSKTHCKKEE
jgi:hypothetical protein